MRSGCGCHLIRSHKPVSGGLDCLCRGDLLPGYDKVANLLCGFGVALRQIMPAKDSVEVKVSLDNSDVTEPCQWSVVI
jgi:hypothetical protein